MPTLDLKKDLKYLYSPSARSFTVVDVPPMNFLMIDGKGNPNTAQDYKDAVEALYATAYNLKFAVKKDQEIDYPVMALEGLWWADDMRAFSAERKDEWHWTMLIMQPDLVTATLVAATIEQMRTKKKLPALARLRFECFHEGLSVQIMHTGPYDAEAPTIAAMHEFVAMNGYERRGKHHEIYLGDPRRTSPANLKTVLRQPIQPKRGERSDSRSTNG
ncbi:MAG: GyrI-like domain-containing protein [Anaerolineae bacterium]|nr:GyrI-like domain-containing protein [Anaerolineae bacterium]